MSKEVYLTKGKVAVVDDEDFPLVSKFKWYAFKAGYVWYAARKERGKSIGRKCILMHRFLLALPPALHPQVDHRNRDGLDNQRHNLRLSNQSQNRANSVILVRKSSAYRGVTWDRVKKQWKAQIQKNRVHHNLGWFASEIEAAGVFDVAAKDLHGDFAVLNFRGGKK